jgi:hypothetical protein
MVAELREQSMRGVIRGRITSNGTSLNLPVDFRSFLVAREADWWRQITDASLMGINGEPTSVRKVQTDRKFVPVNGRTSACTNIEGTIGGKPI